MPERKTRVDFNAPESLVEEADTVAELLDTSRTSLLIDALRKQLDEIAGDERFHRRLREAYYDGRVGFDALETILGSEEAMRAKLLRESIDREPPAPERGTVDLPPAGEFYDGELPEWPPDDESEDAESSSPA